MRKTKTTKTKMLLSLAGLAAAVSTVSLAIEPAHAIEEGTSCLYGSNGALIPEGTEVIDGDYTIVIRDGKLFHRHRIYKCGADRMWQSTGFVDLETSVIGCCPRGKAEHGEILT
jgi:hypothetical protein